MGIAYNPRTVTDGLVLTLDGANYKSFKGEVTTNLIPNPTVNAYPTTGNAWGTYNTNQYNAGSFFSIGSISSVSSNIITTSTNHPLRTYDVVRPQTTGGGVVQNNDYFVKKLSDTTFTLHAYNSSQDGSQGYINSSTGNHKVYDSLSSPLSVSIGGGKNPSFPTMWWGAPHLPNSGLVKELRYGEFNAIPNLPANDCIRLHYIRTDDVKDGMSYNVDCTVTPSSPVTISFYTRAANANAVGKVIQYYIYNYVSTPTGTSAQGYAWNFTLGALGVWERQTFTYTPAYGTMISYWFPQSSGVYSWDWSCMQVEQKSYVTNFVAGTRGSTVATGGGWVDLSGRGNNGELVNGVRESSDNLGALVFDGTNDYVEVDVSSFPSGASSFSVGSFIKWNGNGSATNDIIFSYGLDGSNNAVILWINNSGYAEFQFGSDTGKVTSTSTISTGIWYHILTTYDKSQTKIYINSELQGTTNYSSGNIVLNNNVNGNKGAIGRFISPYSSQVTSPAGYGTFNGNIAQVQIYNRALTASEIQQNFNASRGRFGI
jgi:hypothetical protein